MFSKNKSISKWIGLSLLLIIPSFIYLFISKADNNFMKLSFVGPENHVIPDFSFVNQNNEIITNDDYRGNIYVANFFFTTCPTICPIMTYNMRIVQQRLSVYPKIKFLSVTLKSKLFKLTIDVDQYQNSKISYPFKIYFTIIINKIIQAAA